MHGTLRFLYLSHLLYGICVKIFLTNRYISKSYTMSKNAIDRQYTERGAAVVSTITSFIEDKTKYVLVTRRAFCGHFCLLVPGYNLNFRFLRTWSIYFFVFVVFVCTGILMDKMPAKSLRSVSMTESQTALICNLKFAKINFPRVRKRSRMEKFGPFPYTEKFFFFH